MIEGKGLRHITTLSGATNTSFPQYAHRVKVLPAVGAHFDRLQVLLLPAAAR